MTPYEQEVAALVRQELISVSTILMVNELLPRLKKCGLTIEQSPVTSEEMARLAAFKCAKLFNTHEIRQLLNERFEKVKPV